MEKIKIIMDVDPGHDDAIAILLAASSPNIELLGISVASGNQTIEKTSINTSNICHYLGINVPIAKGSPCPLIKEPLICKEIHGESGLDGFNFPSYNHKFDTRSGAQLIIDTIMNNDDVTVVTTGPLTNLALAIRLEPKIIKRIKEVVMMGGSIDYGNISPAAEFNILVDPEAAYIVFNSHLKIKMLGLNVTRKVLVLPEIIKRMDKIDNKASELFTKLMKVFNENQKKVFGYEGAPLHDPITIVSLIDKNCITFKDMNVTIDISKGSSYGRTNCDVLDYLKAEHNASVAIDVDVNRYWDIIEEGIRSYDD